MERLLFRKKYLEKKYNEIKLPVEYESYSSWDTMIMYVETYSIILAIIVGFICAGIFADDFQTKADAVFFSLQSMDVQKLLKQKYWQE